MIKVILLYGKPLLKYRIIKESNSYDRLQEDVESYLAHLKDDFKIEVAGSQLIGNPIRNNYYIRNAPFNMKLLGLRS